MVRSVLWLKQFFWVEPLNGFDAVFGTKVEGIANLLAATAIVALAAIPSFPYSRRWPSLQLLL